MEITLKIRFIHLSGIFYISTKEPIFAVCTTLVKRDINMFHAVSKVNLFQCI